MKQMVESYFFTCGVFVDGSSTWFYDIIMIMKVI